MHLLALREAVRLALLPPVLAAIIAHERGHQLLARHPQIGPRLGAGITLAAEEVLASLIGAMVCGVIRDHDALVGKATAELLRAGTPAEDAVRLIQNLTALLREYL